MTTTTTPSPSGAASISLLPERPVEVRVQQDVKQAPPSVAEVEAAQPAWWRAAAPRRVWVWASVFVIACGWDRAVWLAVKAGTMPSLEAIEAVSLRRAITSLFSWSLSDAAGALAYFGYHAIKLFGTVWIPAGVGAWLVLRPLFQPDTGRVRVGLRRGVLLFLAPAAAGLAAEAIKLLTRRQRPEFADGAMSFRFHDFWNGSGLGLPSSHAAVAVAATLALTALWPRPRWVWIAMGALCALSRVLAGAHFVSDVLVGVLVGLAAARAVIAIDLKNNNGAPACAAGGVPAR